MKLLGKVPEERYPSATELRADLEHSAKQWTKNNIEYSISLRQTRRLRSLCAPTAPVMGANGSSMSFLQAFDEVCKGRSALLLVSG
jgi:hypothetical protein